MADAPKPEEKKSDKKDDHGESHGSAVKLEDFKILGKIILWTILVVLVLVFSYTIVLVNKESAQNFIYFLNGLEILLGIYLILNIFKLRGYMHKFEHSCEHIGEIFAHKYHPEEKKVVNLSPQELRYERAKAHMNSNYKEEWKIGVIELDTILKDLLKSKYTGDTVGELLIDAEKKGFKNVATAWEAHKVRNKIVHEGIKYEMDKPFTEKVFRNYAVVFQELGLS